MTQRSGEDATDEGVIAASSTEGGVRVDSASSARSISFGTTFVLGAALVAALAVVSPIVGAFEVHPLVHRIDSHGRLSSSNIVVTNRSDQPLPLEFGVHVLEYDGESALRGAPADDDLLVFPPSAIIPPGGVQAARLQWLGDPDIDTARSYIVTVEQIPAFRGEDGDASGVQVLLTFNVFVHVSPPGAEPRLVLREQRIESADGRSTLYLRLRNEGTGNAYGSLISFDLDAGGRLTRVLPASDGAVGAELFFPPGFERDVELPLPRGEWPASTAVDIVYDK